VSITAAETSDVFSLKEYHAARIFVMAGALAVNMTTTVLKCTDAAGGTAAAIAFRYRETAAVGTDTMGAWAWATSTGQALTGTTDNNIMIEILVESSELTPVSGVEYPYIKVTMTPASGSACLVACMAILEPRYAQAIPPSAVD
jgi:hypothetical protein